MICPPTEMNQSVVKKNPVIRPDFEQCQSAAVSPTIGKDMKSITEPTVVHNLRGITIGVVDV